MSHSEIIERLEKLTGPSREVDALIVALLRYDPTNQQWVTSWTGEWRAIQGLVHLIGDHGSAGNFRPPRLTASLDAIVALIEQKLPGAYGSIQFGTEPNKVVILKDSTTVLPSGHYKIATSTKGRGEGATPAIACCIALLKALEAGT